MSFTPEQLLERRKGLGASEAAAACGQSKWTSRLKLYLQKTGQLVDEDDNEKLQFDVGHALEPVAIKWLERKMGITVTDRQLRVVDPNWPKRWATLDGRSSDGGVVQAKSVGVADPREWGDEYQDSEVPIEYLIQVHHEMGCSGLEFAWMPVVILNRQFRVYRVRRDEEMVQLVAAREREFWDMVESGTPPPVETLEDAKLLWPSHKADKRIEADDDIARAVWKLKRSKARSKKLEDLQDALKLHIQSHMADAAELIYIGKPIVTWKQAKPSMKFDEDQFAIDCPILYREYLKEVPGSRRMLTK